MGRASAGERKAMKYLHTMVRVRDLEESLDFYCTKLGLKELSRIDNERAATPSSSWPPKATSRRRSS